eukprot:jgi/Chrpa1/21563/Chrysochromulina_OHIO_Genome00011104-RA
MLDASLAADAIVSSSSVLPVYVPSDFGHSLDNLVPDMFNTAMIAGLGLMGAYVTQVCESTVQRTSPALVTKLTLHICTVSRAPREWNRVEIRTTTLSGH